LAHRWIDSDRQNHGRPQIKSTRTFFNIEKSQVRVERFVYGKFILDSELSSIFAFFKEVTLYAKK